VKPKTKALPQNIDQDVDTWEDSSSTSSDRTRRSTPLSGPIFTTNIMDCAVNRFFYDYILPEAQSGSKYLTGVFEYLPTLFQYSPEETSLKEAVYTVALANFDRRSGCSFPNIRTEIDKHYGNTLRLVAEGLSDPREAQTNQLLIAVQMLGIFEQMNTGGNNIVFVKAHATGMAALIKARQKRPINDEYEWRIIRNINSQMIAACLKLGIPSFVPYSALKHFYEDARFPLGRIFSLLHQGVDILALWNSISYSIPANEQAEKAALLQQMVVLDAQLDAWEQEFPPAAKLLTIPTPDVSSLPKWLRHVVEHPGMPPTVHVYDSVQVIYIWNLYRLLRFSINRVLLITSLRCPMPGGSITTYQDIMQRMVDDACSSIVAIYTQPIAAKPVAGELADVVGFRPMMSILPLNLAKAGLMHLPDTKENKARREWADSTLAFTMTTFHNSKWVC
jgi:hypothetical protein